MNAVTTPTTQQTTGDAGLPTRSGAVLQTFALGAQWPTIDPFLFVAHHRDAYPKGNESGGPEASLEGREIGSDFAGREGWNMYHGSTVPGFPQHPHRGFETVTYVRSGIIDHADSLGAAARFGRGDTQWMTAGSGVVHSEMFPLLDRDGDNPLELFQIWLNLPKADKMVDPYFTMLWSEDTPVVESVDADGRSARVTVIAGALAGAVPSAPPPDSWASNPDADVAIWHVTLDRDAVWEMPAPNDADVVRVVYVFDGSNLDIDGTTVAAGTGAFVTSARSLALRADGGPVEGLVLQGRPIGEPVARYGPFVMNDEAGIRQAFNDYRTTEFGGWPWPSNDPVHSTASGRFARHADGRMVHR